MGHTDDLLDGIAQYFAGADIAKYQDTAYSASDTGIGIGKLPAGCDLAIGITDYLTNDAYPDQALTTIGVQLMFRGSPNDRRSMTDLRDSAYQLLQNLTYRQFGVFGCIQALRVSSVPLGQDEAERFLMSDNYYVDGTVPSTPFRT